MVQQKDCLEFIEMVQRTEKYYAVPRARRVGDYLAYTSAVRRVEDDPPREGAIVMTGMTSRYPLS